MNDRSDRVESPWRRVRRWVGYLIGAALLIACIVVAARAGDWAMLKEAHLGAAAFLLYLVAMTLFFSGTVFSAATEPYEQSFRPVSFLDMQALIAASTLLNYLPFRPGLAGRAAYLKHVHGISYRSSVIILLRVIGISLVVYVMALAAALTTGLDGASLLFAAVGPVGLAGLLVFCIFALRENREQITFGVRTTTGFAATMRAAEFGFTTLRLMIVFLIVGLHLEVREAIVLASCGMFITLVGITPNGLGLREWLYGLIAASGFFCGDVEAGLQLGLTAGLVDRAAEVLVVAPTGTASIFYLFRRARRAEGAKSEIRNPKSETNPNDQMPQ